MKVNEIAIKQMCIRDRSRTIYGISPELRKLNLISNKHIPDIYLRADYNQRLDLLRGYMDGDGSVSYTHLDVYKRQ